MNGFVYQRVDWPFLTHFTSLVDDPVALQEDAQATGTKGKFLLSCLRHIKTWIWNIFCEFFSLSVALFFLFSVPLLKTCFFVVVVLVSHMTFCCWGNYVRNVSTRCIWENNFVQMFKLYVLLFDVMSFHMCTTMQSLKEAVLLVLNIKGECLFS